MPCGEALHALRCGNENVVLDTNPSHGVSPTGLLSAIDIVEVNPKQVKKQEEVHLTASVAVDLVLGCFGRVREGSHPADYKIPDPWEEIMHSYSELILETCLFRAYLPHDVLL